MTSIDGKIMSSSLNSATSVRPEPVKTTTIPSSPDLKVDSELAKMLNIIKEASEHPGASHIQALKTAVESDNYVIDSTQLSEHLLLELATA